MSQFPARVHILLASHAPLGVAIRRGPSKQVATVLWDRRRDQFQLGQWLKGRIYERRSDLSPDGQHLIYFAHNGKWRSETGGSWTAVSRAPYLKATTLYAKGDCWHGGGLWTNKNTYWLNDAWGHRTLRDSGEVKRDKRYKPSEEFGGECPGVYYLRLLRDGWSLGDRIQTSRWKSADVFEKPLPKGWTLRKIAHAQIDSPAGKGCYWDEHQLLHEQTQKTIAEPDWEWAELDGLRLVWVKQGKLFAADIREHGLADARELYDFNALSFEALRAPY